jgi:pimeloyl-ACP methyl ester carboxylesterase
MKRIAVNGVELAYLEEGEGPLVLLLHGFPDTAHTWDEVRPALARAGYRAVSPWMRGYHPSGLAPDGRYDGDTLAADAIALVSALGAEQAVLVGHDYGALAAYIAATTAPERFTRLVTLAIPHPAVLRPTPGVVWRGRHIPRFKLPGAVGALRAGGFALVDELLRRWSPRWQVPEGETRHVKESFAQPGCAEAAIAYYKQLPFRAQASLRPRIQVPAVAFAGESDGVLFDLEPYERARSRFASSYRVVRMPGGHFLHREHPERFNQELLATLREERLVA